MRNKLHLLSLLHCVFLYTLHIYLTGVQAQQNQCNAAFRDHYNVSETDPPNTEVLRFQTPAGVSWTMSVSYDQLPAGARGQLDPYLSLSRGVSGGGHYVLSVQRQLDLEEINERLGQPLNTITLQLTCSQPGLPNQTNEVIVTIDPVNEYFPEFVGGPFTVNISEAQAVGYVIISLDSVSRDQDVRPSTGEIYAYSMEPLDSALFNGRPEADGREFFTMTNTQRGTIEVAEKLDFERLDHDGRTTMWLNVTVTDYARNTNWTTIKVNVLDDDDLSPEFFVKGVCVPQPYKVPPCPVTFRAKFPRNATGVVSNIGPGPIYAYDRDTINNSVTYSLRDKGNSPGVSLHFTIDPHTAELRVVRPFTEAGEYSLYIMAEEVSRYRFPAQTTLDVEILPPASEISSTSSPRPTGGAGSGDHGNGGGEGGDVGKTGRSTDEEENNSEMVAIIGLTILGFLVVVLAVALFISCMKLRHHRLGRVGSAGTSGSSRKSFVNEEVLPEGADDGHQLDKKRQGDLYSAPNPDVFDGTRSFEDGVSHEFFKAHGKTKVALLLPSDATAATIDPIIIDDGM
ncbi:protocadherin-15-like isoform X2 [Babylonia areolata]|uniref:protocadherin-15-like isoform X2 n=1 Tax=Babylonia areolata TaxID=304850 RepID=UPI003FD48F1E